MSKQESVRSEMVKAMKEKDKSKKETLSLLLAALKNAEIDKMGILSESEEDAVVQKEIKQTKETLDLAPADRTDIIQECKYRIEVLSQFAPKVMTEEEIEAIIAGVLSDLGIEKPTKKEKGKIMKTLMPMVKGKADGKLVNQILEKKLAYLLCILEVMFLSKSVIYQNLERKIQNWQVVWHIRWVKSLGLMVQHGHLMSNLAMKNIHLEDISWRKYLKKSCN